uniref:Uncharacterized protein n=1 Tax=Romanomermis culicivorax TaxID=13658 RepID=A0A915J5H4_ROMCU
MGVKRKAPGDDKAQADKFQQTNAKSPDTVEANKARTRARMEVIPKANKARGDTIEEGLEEAIDAVGSSKMQEKICKGLDQQPTTCHNMQTEQRNPKSTQFGTEVWGMGLLRDLRGFAKELSLT